MFKGHHFIKIEGNAYQPSRFWSVLLLTDKEFNQLNPNAQVGYRPIKKSDINFLIQRFN